MTIPAFRCDITIVSHDCTNPLMSIELCTLCKKRTCGSTRCAFDRGIVEKMIKPWAECLECSKRCRMDPQFEKFRNQEMNKCIKVEIK